MDSRLRLAGNPIQPMLVTFPFGLFVCATVFDVAAVAGAPALLGQVGYWTLVAGLVAAALTAVAGLIDLWDAPGGRTRRTAVSFNVVNAATAGLFVLACLVRAGAPEHRVTGGMVALELLGVAAGSLGVVLGSVLMRKFDRVRTDPVPRGGTDSSLAAVLPATNAAVLPATNQAPAG